MAESLVDRSSIVLGVPIDDVTLDDAIDRIAAMVEVGRTTGRTHQVATVNVDFVVNVCADPALLQILQNTDLAVPDGMPIVWGSRLLGTPLRQRTAGADLIPALAASCARRRHRVCFFGGAPGVAERAAEHCRTEIGDTDIVAIGAPDVASDGSMSAAARSLVRAAQADVVCVALGNPKQERWIDRYRGEIGAPVFIGIGGTLDFLTGTTQRAPSWMQQGGLEWLHRALREPRRLARRYARDLLVFGPGLLRQWVVGRWDSSSTIQAQLVSDATCVQADVGSLRRLGNRGAAHLCGIHRAARRRGRSVKVVGVNDSIRRSAERLRGGRWIRDSLVEPGVRQRVK